MAQRVVLQVLSEAVPFSKTGGLGDVGGALPAALARLGLPVVVVLPAYPGAPPGPVVARFPRNAWFESPAVRIRQVDRGDGVAWRFVDVPEYYERDGVYGTSDGDYLDNDRRFALLAKAAIESCGALGEQIDVLHAHDWQAGLTPLFLAQSQAGLAPSVRAASVFTIHNLAYQGLFPPETIPAVGLGWETFVPDGLEFWGQASFLKAGIVYADMVSTVSRRYAQEIQTPEQGFGLDGVLRHRADSLVGIPNGIDATMWDPERDPYLPAGYSAHDLGGKVLAKRALLEAAGLPVDDRIARPLIGMVSRMVDQKGLDIIAGALNELLQMDVSFVILGTGDARYQEMWRRLAREHPATVSVTVGFSEQRAHLIEAGADLFMMPSRFEPCGLNQLYSLRYGTVPLVRATGGLDDTVTQVDHETGVGTGFKFSAYTSSALVDTIRYALSWYAKPDAWRAIQAAGMREDHSWDASAREYVQLYDLARQRLAQRV